MVPNQYKTIAQPFIVFKGCSVPASMPLKAASRVAAKRSLEALASRWHAQQRSKDQVWWCEAWGVVSCGGFAWAQVGLGAWKFGKVGMLVGGW